MTTPSSEPTCPAGVLGWIPWYPDGLADEERGAVEAHAAECDACREEIAFLCGDAEPRDAAPDPERVYVQVLARIEAGASQPAIGDGAAGPLHVRAGPGPASRASRPRRIETRRILSLAAGVLVALAVGAGLGRWLDGRSEPVYRTAMAPADASLPSAPALDVVFRDDAGAAGISQALRELDAQITSGPSQVGVYRLSLPADADVAAAARLLMGDRGVATFAEKSLEP